MKALNESRIKYLSPTSIMAWRKDQEAFYLQYVAQDKPPRFPQTEAMAVGSAFDAYVKGYLAAELLGDAGMKEKLLTSQVESQNRERAWKDGAICFEAYQRCGALSDLMLMCRAGSNLRMEFTVTTDSLQRPIGEAILLGKPDAYFTTPEGAVILDWKVNGFYSKSTTSPSKGYVALRGTDGSSKAYKESFVCMHRGVGVNSLYPMNLIKDDWALQTCIYSWLMGADVGGDFIVAIDQLVCNQGVIKVAQFRSIVSPEYQHRLYDEIQGIWEAVNSDHVFRHLSIGESQGRCELLENRALALRENPDFADMIPRPTW